MTSRNITRSVAKTPHVPDDADPFGVVEADRDEARTYIRWLFEQRLHRAEIRAAYEREQATALGPPKDDEPREALSAMNATEPAAKKPAAKKPAAKKPAAKPAAPQYSAQVLSLSQAGGSYVTILDVPEPAPKVTYDILKAKREAERN